MDIKFDDPDMLPADKEFLKRIEDIGIQNISNADFGIKDLAGQTFLSERQLRRKVTEIAGISPLEFIRQIRLQKAKELLENRVYFSISEVSAAVGFNNPHYFARLFRKRYGMAPGEMQ